MFLMYSTLHIKKDNLHYTFVAKSIRHNIITDIESLHSEMLQARSLYISHMMSNFYGTEIEICADFGPAGNTKNYEQLL